MDDEPATGFIDAEPPGRVLIVYGGSNGRKSLGTVSTVPPCTGLLERAAFEQRSVWDTDLCSAALGREERIDELKREVNALLAAQGSTPRYPSVSGDAASRSEADEH